VKHVFAHDACVAGCAQLRPLSEFSNSQVPPPRRPLFLCLVLFIALIYLNVSYAEGQGRRIVSAAAVAELYYPTAMCDLYILDLNPRAPQRSLRHPVLPSTTSSRGWLQWTHAEAMKS
jgi:hypothetical protein